MYVCMLCASSMYAQKVVYVDLNAKGTNDGSSWKNAYTQLQPAIQKAANMGGAHVWVAQGTYKPTLDSTGKVPTNNRNKCFVLEKKVQIFGGFNGTEQTLEMRNFNKYQVILSGEIQGNTSQIDNAYHVVYSLASADTTAQLDGVTITQGYADAKNGAGGFIQGALLRNCIIYNNLSTAQGGGVYATRATIIDCEFKYNTAQHGGACYVFNTTITKSTLHHNSATGNGAGAYVVQSNISKNILYYNHADVYGGALYTIQSVIDAHTVYCNKALNGAGVYCGASNTIQNTLITNNTAIQSGGGVYILATQNKLINNSITLNIAPSGGGVYAMEQVVVGNSLLWKNSQDIEAQSIVMSYTFLSDNSYISNGTDSVWVVDETKGFVIKTPDTVGYAVTPQGLENIRKANWEPVTGSQLCDKANYVLAQALTRDCVGNNRFNRNSQKPGVPIADIGAFEAKSSLMVNTTRIIYMKPRWTGTGDGSSWENATSNLQSVLQSLSSMYFPVPPQIWMQQGIYYPTSSSLPFGFQIKSTVHLYGGFKGTETSIDERNLLVYNSQLSGEFGVFGDNSDNVENVLYVSHQSIVDGFSITGAKGTGVQLFNFSTLKNCEILYNGVEQESAGVKMYDSYMEHCKVHHNMSTKSSYAGVYAYSSRIKDSYVFENTALYYAGGVYAFNSTIENSYIYNNSVTDGMFAIAGGVYATGNTVLTGCNVYNNRSEANCGGVFLDNSILRSSSVYGNLSLNFGGGISSNGSGIIEACIVENNSALRGGGLYYIKNAVNTVIANNSAYMGGAVYGFSNISYATIVNNASDMYGSIFSNSGTIMASIVWGNTSVNWQYPIFFQNSGDVLYSAVQGGWSGNGTFLLDHRNTDSYGPHFVEPTTVAGVTSQQGDWRIQASSMCIDKSIFTQDIPSTDLLGKCRVIGENPDVGAYEQGVSVYDTLQLQRIYVSTTGEGDGSSWTKAMNNIHKALFLADYLKIPEVWVAQGTYLTSEVRDRSVNFTLRTGVTLYGGFKGNEQFLQERVLGAYPSILSGDIGRMEREYDNAYRILYYSPTLLSDTSVIDGFVIRNSYNENELGKSHCAAEISQVKITNCIFTKNTGIALRAKGCVVHNCMFSENNSSEYGAAVQIEQSKFTNNTVYSNQGKLGGGVYADRSTISDCYVYSNTAQNGGGIYALKSNITRTSLYNNTAEFNGGGLYCFGMPSSISNNVIYNNTANEFGGGVYVDSITSFVYNTIAANKAIQQGGGMYAKGPQASELLNTLFWNNISSVDSSVSLQNNVFRITLTNNAFSSDISVNYDKKSIRISNENVRYDSVAPYPRFINPSRFVGATTDSLDALLLSYCKWEMHHNSPCLDVAKNIPSITSDYYTRPRIIKGVLVLENGNPDIGAIESKSIDIETKGIIYMAPEWKGLGDGSTWANARNTFPDVMAKASHDSLQVWVSQGVYLPTADSTGNSADTLNKRLFCFTMKNNARVYGGFKGDETELQQRNPIDYKTILSGFPQVYEDRQNSYHVLYSPQGTDTSALFDGFYIMGGNADDFIDRSLQKGGGVYAHGGTISRCVVVGNTAYREAGGVYMKQGTRLINSVVANNYSFTSVGGVSAFDTCIVDASSIVRNAASKMYGGIFSQPDVTISNSVVWGNKANTNQQINRIDNCEFTAIQSDTVFTSSILYALATSNTQDDAGKRAPRFVLPSELTETILNQSQIFELFQSQWALQSTSYLKNKANSKFISLCGDDFDIRYMERIVGDTADLGAFEYNGIPKILNELQDVHVCVSQDATYSIQAQGANLQYQWEYIDGVVWKPLTANDMFQGVSSSTLHIYAAYYLEQTINVRCKVYNQDGSIYSNVGYVTVAPLPKKISKTHYTICDGELIILPVENETTVTWADGRVSISIQPRTTNWYTYTMQNQYGCSITDSIHVSIGLLPQQPFAADTVYLCSGTYVWLQTDNAYVSYAWNDNSKHATLQIFDNGVYGVTVKDFNGCSLYDSVTVIITEAIQPIVNGISYTKDGSEIILATNTQSPALKEQQIHRALANTYVFTNIGTLSRTAKIYKDAAIQEQKNYSYAIKAIDSCGFASSFSTIHTPLNLEAYRRITNKNIVDLFWSSYKGLPQAAEYQIYRGKTKQTMEFVATVPASQMYYSLTIDGYNYYSISMAIPQSFSYQNSLYTHTYSNVAQVRDWNGITSTNRSEYVLYPNPVVQENATLKLPQSSFNRVVYVFDLQGKEIYTLTVSSNDTHVELPMLQCLPGMYICMITQNGRLQFVEKIMCK